MTRGWALLSCLYYSNVLMKIGGDYCIIIYQMRNGMSGGDEVDYKVLMIDDDKVIAESTAEYFNMFDIKTAYVTGYDEAVDFLENNRVSLLLLDINLGEHSGFELCKKVRESYDMPILFISARNSDDDVLIALNIGGDDYIKKPYTLSILLAKVKTILARYEKAKEDAELAAKAYSAGGEKLSQDAAPADGKDEAGGTGLIRLNAEVVLDTNTRKLRKGDEQINLRAMEYKMLVYLLNNKNRVVTKDELLKNVWDYDYIGEGTLSVHIRHLREKVESDSKNPDVIKTVWGVGYMVEY